MRLAYPPSCRFAVVIPDLAHLALWVRDAGRLVVPQAEDVPPPRAPAAADHARRLIGADQQVAGSQWLGWWRAIIAVEGRRQLAPTHPADTTPSDTASPGSVTVDSVARARWCFEDTLAAADSPRFPSLIDRPDLRAAVCALHDVPDPAFEAAHRAVLAGQLIDQAVFHQAGRAVARERHVPINTLNAAVVVLLVQGVWWNIATTPGVVLASVDAAHDQRVATRLARAAYRSALDIGR